MAPNTSTISMRSSSRLDFHGLCSFNSKLSPSEMVGSSLQKKTSYQNMVNFQVNSWIYFIVVMIFTHLFWLQKSKNDIIQLNDGRNSTDPNLDARLFTFFTGDTQTVVVVGALLPQTRRFLQVWGSPSFETSHDFEVGGWQQHLPKVWKHQTFKKGWRSRLPDFQGSPLRPAAELELDSCIHTSASSASAGSV